MIRTVRGLPTTGVEATLLRLAHELGEEEFEVACEDARRRQLTSIAALERYLERHARRGRPGGEHDHEKWSVAGRCGYRIVFATWDKVTKRPDDLLAELGTALAA
jgi:hypothetical protein